MTYEEAIEILQEEHDFCQEMSYVIKALQMAIEALEKQIPNTPKVKEETYSRFYDCPSCGGYLVSEIDGELCSGKKYKYCYSCGQALDWSDTE